MTADAVAAPQPTRMVLLRHARTALTGIRYCGSTDPELSTQGHAEAELAGRRVAARVPEAAAVISSPLRRAAGTAQIIAGRYRLPVCHEPLLRELDFGRFEGLGFDEARAGWPAEHAAWLEGGISAHPPDGESLAAVARRTALACSQIVASYAARTVILVSHATPIATVLCAALGAPLEAVARLQLTPAGLSWIDWYGPEHPVLRCLNDTPDPA